MPGSFARGAFPLCRTRLPARRSTDQTTRPRRLERGLVCVGQTGENSLATDGLNRVFLALSVLTAQPGQPLLAPLLAAARAGARRRADRHAHRHLAADLVGDGVGLHL